MRIILGLVLVAVGVIMTIKSEWLYQNFGSIAFFEEKMHMYGGSRFGYKMVGILAAFIGILIFTNLHSNLILAVLRLFPGIGGQP